MALCQEMRSVREGPDDCRFHFLPKTPAAEGFLVKCLAGWIWTGTVWNYFPQSDDFEVECILLQF